jgi:hypothetical protein
MFIVHGSSEPTEGSNATIKYHSIRRFISNRLWHHQPTMSLHSEVLWVLMQQGQCRQVLTLPMLTACLPMLPFSHRYGHRATYRQPSSLHLFHNTAYIPKTNIAQPSSLFTEYFNIPKYCRESAEIPDSPPQVRCRYRCRAMVSSFQIQTPSHIILPA